MHCTIERGDPSAVDSIFATQCIWRVMPVGGRRRSVLSYWCHHSRKCKTLMPMTHEGGLEVVKHFVVR